MMVHLRSMVVTMAVAATLFPQADTDSASGAMYSRRTLRTELSPETFAEDCEAALANS
jgi:hypothetical protein